MSLRNSRKVKAAQSFKPVPSVSIPDIPDSQSNGTRLLTPDDVASILGTSRLFVIRKSRAGKIPALKVGKVYRYRPESIQAWTAAQENPVGVQ